MSEDSTTLLLLKNSAMSIFFSKRTFLVGFLLVGTLSLSACGAPEAAPVSYKVSLEVWGVFDDTGAYAPAIQAYKKINPNVDTISYRKLPVETYHDDLINAFASGKGPDIFMIRNSWRVPFEDKTAPAPATLISEQEYRNRLVDVAADDFIGTDSQIYGIPLSVDSLALYYNKDLFNVAGVTTPPATWNDVVADVTRLNSIDQFGTFLRSGIALGTGANINRSSDILMVLALQSQSEILDRPQASPVKFTDEGGEKAFTFYTQFAQIKSSTYSWNARQDYSIDAFYKGNLAMMLNYSWQYDTIKQKNAKLNIGIAPLPQFDLQSPVNLANYWGFAVSKNIPAQTAVSGDLEKRNAARTFEAWQFLKFLALVGNDKKMNIKDAFSETVREVALESDPTADYLKATRKPAARRDLIAEQKNDLILSSFAYGNLIAKNWYQGDSDVTDGILIDAIDSVGRGEKSWKSAFDTAANRINLLVRE